MADTSALGDWAIRFRLDQAERVNKEITDIQLVRHLAGFSIAILSLFAKRFIGTN
jgi:hypothetical protein